MTNTSRSYGSGWKLFSLIALAFFAYTIAVFRIAAQCTPSSTPFRSQTLVQPYTIHSERASHTKQTDSLSSSRPSSLSAASSSSSNAAPQSQQCSNQEFEAYSFKSHDFIISGNPDDTTGGMISFHRTSSTASNDYPVCTFTNVCATSDRLYFRLSNESQHAHISSVISKCFAPGVPNYEMNKLCHCFHPGFLPAVLPVGVDTKANGSRYGHAWGIHKWVSSHHIAHWAQKLLLFQSIYQHECALRIHNNHSQILPSLSHILFHDSDLPLSDHEAAIFNVSLLSALSYDYAASSSSSGGVANHSDGISLSELLDDRRILLSHSVDWNSLIELVSSSSPHPLARSLANNKWRYDDAAAFIWMSQLMESKKHNRYQCFERVSFTPAFGIFSISSLDTNLFRKASYYYHHLRIHPDFSCPPYKTVLLYRHDRKILNEDEIKKYMIDEYGIQVESLTIDGTSSSLEQTSLFASAGLLIASHSSQLINVMFTPPGAAIIEIAPNFYNADFSEYAHGMGVFFQYALGGEIPNGKEDPQQTECLNVLSTCHGASHCILNKRWSCHMREYPNKNLNFKANMTAVKVAVSNSIMHLNWLCNGRWKR